MSLQIIETGIGGCRIEQQRLIGNAQKGVVHFLPGGSKNPEWFGGEILDVYGFYAAEKNTFCGGHYHPKLHEMFFTISGTALWVVSDFRPNSPTFEKTTAFILGHTAPPETNGLPTYLWQPPTGVSRVRVPSGVYHIIFSLTDEGFVSLALGSTAYDAEDYRYPKPEEVPGMADILKPFGIPLPTTTTK